MSNPHSESKNAAPTVSVIPEQGHRNPRDDDDQSKSHRRLLHPARSTTSLLTQALTSERESLKSKDTSADAPRKPPQVLTAPAHSGQPSVKSRDRLNNTQERPADKMAVVVPSPTRDAGTTLSLRATPSSSISREFQRFDMNHVNSLLTSHRDFLNKARGRGTSLERTEKEKRVHDIPKGPISTNPGDTGMTNPSPPDNQAKTESISTTPPTEGVRARYRSWRDVKPGMAAEKAWSIGQQGSDDSQGGQVEKSIAEALAGIEHNNRSRKASHSLRFFKEGLPEDKSKKRDGKLKSKGLGIQESGKQRHSQEFVGHDLSEHNQKHESQDGTSPLQSPRASGQPFTPDSNPTVGLTAEEGYFDNSHNVETISEEQLRTMPAQLLAEIRKHHNLTPGAAKGSSFSRSIPVTASERPKNDDDLEPPTTAESQDVEEGNSNGTELSKEKSCDDDESGEEQISSALFVPHQTPHVSPEREKLRLENISRLRSTDQSHLEDSQQWLEEHAVPSRDIDEDFYSQEGRSQPQHSLSPIPVPIPVPENDTTFKPQDVPEIDQDSHDDGGYTTKEESSLTDDPDTTPTGSLKRNKKIVDAYKSHVHDHQQSPKEPLEAIELIPYSHQVGGHTTMWRFSKRAVCKQLNNRENEFYEKVERYHPQLLKFLPRYIGVLNVTFEKQQRRRSARKETKDSGIGIGENQPSSNKKVNPKESSTDSGVTSALTSPSEKLEPPRVISQSLHSNSVPIPTVTFADNRHIIPTSFLNTHPHAMDTQYRPRNDTSILPMVPNGLDHFQKPPQESDVMYRPSLSDKHAASWGATTVNKKLRNEVFGEAFLQQPIPIQRHKKPASQKRSLPSRHGTNLRASNSESSLKAAQQSQFSAAQPPEESIRRRAMKTAAGQRHGVAPLIPAPSIASESTEGSQVEVNDGDAELDERTGRSAPEAEVTLSQDYKGKRQRRYSSGGLRRKPSKVADDRGNLKYFEEADDAGYKGDGEEDVFAMDPEVSPASPAALSGVKSLKSETRKDDIVSTKPNLSNSGKGTMFPVARVQPPNLLNIPRPVNPKEAQTQRDSRVEYFLLLEDLTAGMKRPCIMDLKMGTRQYGVEANEKKQKSQRSKCEATTSQKLGVRVCGLQVWDAKSQSYIFQDKYFGRDLKVGREFQNALTRFLYDGVDYSSVLRHIPTILDKLSQLEVLIRGLDGYRFYAASLLMFYDGDVQGDTESDGSVLEKEVANRNGEIDFKIADFANCVTKEDIRSNERLCPPQHPCLPDHGFLRGLRSLRRCFLAIQREISNEIRDGTESHSKGDVFESTYEDEGVISY